MKIFLKLVYYYKVISSYFFDFMTEESFIRCDRKLSYLFAKKILNFWGIVFGMSVMRSALLLDNNILFFNDSDSVSSFQGWISLKELIKKIG